MATNTKRGNHDEALKQDSVNLHLPRVARAARQEVPRCGDKGAVQPHRKDLFYVGAPHEPPLTAT